MMQQDASSVSYAISENWVGSLLFFHATKLSTGFSVYANRHGTLQQAGRGNEPELVVVTTEQICIEKEE